jgi:hypothetical protein
VNLGNISCIILLLRAVGIRGGGFIHLVTCQQNNSPVDPRFSRQSSANQYGEVLLPHPLPRHSWKYGL